MAERKNGVEKHEYLRDENYYESRNVGTRAKSDKTCEHCGESIPKGEPHTMHHFYPEFDAYPTHKHCEENFKESLLQVDEKSADEEEEDE